jgi:hypothetical protein
MRYAYSGQGESFDSSTLLTTGMLRTGIEEATGNFYPLHPNSLSCAKQDVGGDAGASTGRSKSVPPPETCGDKLSRLI